VGQEVPPRSLTLFWTTTEIFWIGRPIWYARREERGRRRREKEEGGGREERREGGRKEGLTPKKLENSFKRRWRGTETETETETETTEGEDEEAFLEEGGPAEQKVKGFPVEIKRITRPVLSESGAIQATNILAFVSLAGHVGLIDSEKVHSPSSLSFFLPLLSLLSPLSPLSFSLFLSLLSPSTHST
jgi:hypothetical protein